MARPYQQAIKELKDFEAEIQEQSKRVNEDPLANAADVLVCVYAPSFSSILSSEAQMRIRQSMLLAATAYASDGESSAAKILDPISSKPFSIKKVKDQVGWIELSSQLAGSEAPVILRARVE